MLRFTKEEAEELLFVPARYIQTLDVISEVIYMRFTNEEINFRLSVYW